MGCVLGVIPRTCDQQEHNWCSLLSLLHQLLVWITELRQGDTEKHVLSFK